MGTSNVGSAIDALRAELREVERQLADYETLRDRRARLLNAIEAAEAVEAMGKPVLRPSHDFGVTVHRVLAQLPFGQPANASEAAILVLKEVGRPVHIRELIGMIQAKGWFEDRTYESLRGTIAGTLDARANKTDGGIAKPERGTYFWTEYDPTVGRQAIQDFEARVEDFDWRKELSG